MKEEPDPDLLFRSRLLASGELILRHNKEFDRLRKEKIKLLLKEKKDAKKKQEIIISDCILFN